MVENIKGISGIEGEWVIRDKHGNIKEQGTDRPTPEIGSEEEK